MSAWWRALASAVVLTAGLAPAASAQATATEAPIPVSFYGMVPREAAGIEGLSGAQQVAPAAVAGSPDAKRGEFVIAPLPMINPTLENGLFLVAGYLYRLDLTDRTTPPSATGGGGFKTSNGSWAAAVLQSLHPWNDRFRVLAVAAYTEINYAFYGIGQSAGNTGASIELTQVGPVGVAEMLVRVYPRWYVGARYQLLQMTVTTGSVAIPDGPVLPAVDADLRTAALGPRLEFDSRDSTFYPRRGTHLQGIAAFYGSAVGGRRTYQAYQGWVDRFHGIGARHVLAWHLGGCGVAGPAPFYDVCLLGKSQDLRGYTIGQYRDRAMLAAQAEWRSELWWRFGGVAFVGGGEVAPDFGSFTWHGIQPGGGAGLRFVLAKRNHVNLRVDYAWGKESSALYIGVAEAF
jgi:hypothetical protein